MPAFRYEAVDGRGKLRQGTLDAGTARQARDRLRAEGLFPTLVETVAAAVPAGAGGSVRLPVALVALSTRQLATLVGSGMPLDQALDAVADQADDARAKKLFAAVRTEV